MDCGWGLTDDSLCSRLLQHIRCLGIFQYIDLNSTPLSLSPPWSLSTPSPYPHHHHYPHPDHYPWWCSFSPCRGCHRSQTCHRAGHRLCPSHRPPCPHLCKALKATPSRCHGQSLKSCFAISKFIPLVHKRRYLFVRTLMMRWKADCSKRSPRSSCWSRPPWLSPCASARSRGWAWRQDQRTLHQVFTITRNSNQDFVIMIMVVRSYWACDQGRMVEICYAVE